MYYTVECKHCYTCLLGHPIDSGMGLSITIDKFRVFINITLSTQSLINQILIKRVGLSIVIDNGKIGQGMRSCKCTNHNLYAGGCQWQWQVCVSDAMVSVCMSRWVSVCVSFLLISFKLSSGCLFSPHHVNQGGVQKTTPQVTLYETPLERSVSTTWEGLCQGSPAVLSCRHSARPPHCRHRHPCMYFHLRGHSKH